MSKAKGILRFAEDLFSQETTYAPPAQGGSIEIALTEMHMPSAPTPAASRIRHFHQLNPASARPARHFRSLAPQDAHYRRTSQNRQTHQPSASGRHSDHQHRSSAQHGRSCGQAPRCPNQQHGSVTFAATARPGFRRDVADGRIQDQRGPNVTVTMPQLAKLRMRRSIAAMFSSSARDRYSSGESAREIRR